MIYISIDLETTGLDPINNQILEFGAVLEDTNRLLPIEELPRFHAYILHPNDEIKGNIYALNMNAGIIEKIKDRKKYATDYNYLDIDALADTFLFWLSQNNLEIKTDKNGGKYTTINAAGKNFAGFDRKFLDAVPGFSDKIRIRHRVIDPAILFVDWKVDESLPSLDQAKKKAGLEGEVAHLAIDDAIDVIKLLRTQYKA